MLPRSLRWRIQLWHTLLLTTIVVVLLSTFYQHQKQITFQEIDTQLNQDIANALPQLNSGRHRPPPHERRPPRPGQERERPNFNEDPPSITFADPLLYAYTINRRGTIQILAGTPPTTQPPSSPNTDQNLQLRTTEGNRELIRRLPRGRIIVIGKSLSEAHDSLSVLLQKLIWSGGILVVGGFTVGSLLTHRSLKPVRDIGHTASLISEGLFSERITVTETKSELGQLSEQLNQTFSKLDESLRRQIRLTADASHEMRTPISVILATSQFALAKERSAEAYQKSFRTCADTAQHMRQLTDSLLELSEIDSSKFTLDLDKHSFTHDLVTTINLIKPLAKQRHISIRVDLPDDDIFATYDSQRIRQVLLNLLSNAVKYNNDGGAIHVSLTVNETHLNFIVRDNGVGISEENLPHIFDRFFRTDKARTTAKGSSVGLGLSITKSIVDAHKGTLSAESWENEGSRFTMTLPR